MNLTDLTRGRTETPGWQRPVPEALKASIGNLGRLPTLPEAATRAMTIAKDPNSSMAQLAAVIERDPALAAGILKLANSPLYRRSSWAVDSLKNAVVRLGERECQNVVLAVGVRSLFRRLPRARQLRYEGLWHHSFLTACLCRRLNQALDLGHDGEEFTAGLSHDIGRVLFGLGAPELFDKADPMDFVEGPDQLPREQALLGTDHGFFGAWFANLNNLPASLVSAVQFHHAPEEAQEHASLVALVATADHIANYYQRDHQIEGYDAESNVGWHVLESHLGSGARARPFSEVAAAVLAEATKEAEDVVGIAS